MPLARLIYVSRNTIGATRSSMSHQVDEILRVSTINNEARAITGSLIFDRDWFVQVLEGRLDEVWRTFKKILPDPRHNEIRFIEMLAVPQRLFGNWWMGSGERNRTTAPVFAPYLRDGQFRPADMTGPELLALLQDLPRLGYARELAPAVPDDVALP